MDRMLMERVRRVYETETYESGVPAILAIAHPEIELVTVAPWLDRTSYVGEDGVRDYFEALERVFGRLEYDLVDLTVHGDALIAEVLVRGEVSSAIFQVLWFEDGRLRRVQGFLDRDDARAAADGA
jgi:ketosteroid isomerase-like protein